MFCSRQKTFFAAAFALVALLIGCATSASSEKAAAAQAQKATTDFRSRHAELPEETEVVELRPFFGVVLTTMRLLPRALGVAIAVMLLASPSRAAIDAPSTIAALRIAGTVTGGLMSTSAPEFAQMVAAIQGGDRLRAATIAANSNYAAKYLLRRLAFQMQNPGLDGSKVTDSDGTTFLMAHFVRATGAQNGISGIWSENATYLVTVTRNAVATQVHGADLTAADLAALDWSSALVRGAGQNAKTVAHG